MLASGLNPPALFHSPPDIKVLTDILLQITLPVKLNPAGLHASGKRTLINRLPFHCSGPHAFCFFYPGRFLCLCSTDGVTCT